MTDPTKDNLVKFTWRIAAIPLKKYMDPTVIPSQVSEVYGMYVYSPEVKVKFHDEKVLVDTRPITCFAVATIEVSERKQLEAGWMQYLPFSQWISMQTLLNAITWNPDIQLPQHIYTLAHPILSEVDQKVQIYEMLLDDIVEACQANKEELRKEFDNLRRMGNNAT